MVKLTTDAYVSLFDAYMADGNKKTIEKAFVEIGAKPDKSFKGVLKVLMNRQKAPLGAKCPPLLFN